MSHGEVVNGRMDIDETTVPDITDEWRMEISYYCVARHLVLAYAGKVANNASSELQTTKQQRMVNGKMLADTLPKYFQRLSDMIDLFEQHLPFPLPLAATFREVTTDTLQGSS
jgi:hypothetical protein